MTPEEKLRRQLFFYRLLSALLLAAIAGSFIYSQVKLWEEGRPFGSNPIIEPRAPFARQVRSIIAPLRYTGLYDFMNPDVYISVDPAAKTWTLNNIHKFDEKGRLLLTKNRFGLCGNLAAHTYEKVKSLFDPERFDVKFLLVSESSYFSIGSGTHIILQIRDRQANPQPKIYLLDPAFRKYGSRHLFGTYRLVEEFDELEIVKHQISGQSFEAGGGPPIHISPKIMLSLYLLPVGGRLDAKNFGIALSARKRYDYQSNRLFTRVMREGKWETTESNEYLRLYLRPGFYEELRTRLIQLSEKVREQEDPFRTVKFPANFSFAQNPIDGPPKTS